MLPLKALGQEASWPLLAPGVASSPRHSSARSRLPPISASAVTGLPSLRVSVSSFLLIRTTVIGFGAHSNAG